MSLARGPQARPAIFEIDPYVPGDSKLPGAGPVIKLSSNETPLGPSPSAVEAFREAAGKLDRYPDGAATALSEALGRFYGLNPDAYGMRLRLGRAVSILVAGLSGAGRRGDLHRARFPRLQDRHPRGRGARPSWRRRPISAPMSMLYLERVTPKTRAVFIANPNNPTGTYIAFDEVRRLRHGLPENVLLVLDGAYAEYVNRNDYEAGIEMVATTPNTRDDAHLLQDLRARRRAGRLGLLPGRGRRRAEPDPWAFQCQRAGHGRRHRRAWRPRASSNARRPTMKSGWTGLPGRSPRSASRSPTALRISCCCIFSDEKGRTAADADEFLAGRRLIVRAAGELRHSARTAAHGRAWSMKTAPWSTRCAISCEGAPSHGSAPSSTMWPSSVLG